MVGIVMFESLTGSMLPFIPAADRDRPAGASAPFVATLVDVAGLVIYFTVASIILRGTRLQTLTRIIPGIRGRRPQVTPPSQ